MEIRKNKEKKGIELYFEAKPEAKIREILKANNFRWHTQKKCWYTKENEQSLKVAKQVQKEVG